MASQAESRLSRKIRKTLEEKYPESFWFKLHISRFQQSGIPDIIGCVDGVPIALETKMPGAPGATKIQERTHKKMRKAGYYVYVITSVLSALEVVDQTLSYKHP